MDGRVDAYARRVVEDALEVGPGDDLMVEYDAPARAFADRVRNVAEQRGASTYTTPPGHAVDASFGVFAPHEDGFDGLLDSRADWDDGPMYADGHRWTMGSYPTALMAERGGTDPDDLADMVYDAALYDAGAHNKATARLRDLVTAGSMARIIDGDHHLALPLDADGTVTRRGVVDDGTHNVPGGEVFTAPRWEAVDGTVYLDGTSYRHGMAIGGVTLTYDDGELVYWDAETGTDELADWFDDDPGMRYIGELGIGTNPAVQGPAGHLHIDEKRRGTVHLALGRMYPQCIAVDGQAVTGDGMVPVKRSGADGHWDLIKDLSSGTLLIDDEIVVADGEIQV